MRTPRNRWQAFLVHLGLSAVIFLVLLYLIVFHWYPLPYFAYDGGWQGVRLITGVDMVLGPLLTLIVYVPHKPGLKRDLIFIALMQTTALIWGTWLVYDQRLVMVTYVDGSFHALSQELVEDAGGKAPEVLAQATTTPPYAFVRLPENPRERTALRLKALATGQTLHRLGDRYEPLTAEHRQEILASGVDMDKYTNGSETDRLTLDQFLARHGGSAADYAFIPLHCRYASLMLALRRNDGIVVDAVDIRPRIFVVPHTRTPTPQTAPSQN